ncbi:MAG TPA: pyridoxal 5'-phosphate synthase glutaminase subunit PdxT [Acidimicrobiia bacterium]
MKVGVLALQGAFREHAEACAALGAGVTLVKRPEHLAAVDAVVLPGGESTTQEKLLESSGLREPLAGALTDGMPCLATCAGVILLAHTVCDGRADQQPLGVLDLDVRRNGYGRQVDSFEADLAVTDLAGGPFHGVFIRAPRIERVGTGVEVLAQHEGDPVLVRSGACVGTTFHPELSADLRIHEILLGAR